MTAGLHLNMTIHENGLEGPAVDPAQLKRIGHHQAPVIQAQTLCTVAISASRRCMRLF